MGQKQDLIYRVQGYIRKQSDEFQRANKAVFDKAVTLATKVLFDNLYLPDWQNEYNKLEVEEKLLEKKLEDIRNTQRNMMNELDKHLREYLIAIGENPRYYYSQAIDKAKDIVNERKLDYVRELDPNVAAEVERYETLLREADLTINLATTPKKTVEAINALMQKFGVDPEDVISELSN